jgi:hypothetical protein
VTTQLECRRLGRTEHRSSIVILGGAMFSAAHPDQVELAFEQAVSAGVNHIDIAPSYGRAEELAGGLVGRHRQRLFVAEKSGRTKPASVRRELETSLTRLGCDQFDLYQAHAVTNLDDLDARADAIESIIAARDEGLTRFVGITGHDLGTAAAQLEALRRYDLDTVMLPIYPRLLADPRYAADLSALLDEAVRRDVGVMAIKVGVHRPWVDDHRDATTWYEPWRDTNRLREGIGAALSLPGVHACCSPGDVTLLPAVLAAALSLPQFGPAEVEAIVTASSSEIPLFPTTR